MTENYYKILALSNYFLLVGEWRRMDDRTRREIHHRSKNQSYLRRERAGRDEVGAAESREEVIERVFVGQVDRRQAQGQALVVGTQQIFGSEAQIEQMSRRDAGRVVVIVHGPVRRNPHAGGAAVRVGAGGQPFHRRGEGAAAKQPDLRLLIGRQRERGRKVGRRSRDQAVVVAPNEGDVTKTSVSGI